MEVDSAYGLIAHAIDEGKAATGYLIVGDVRGNCAELTEMILKKLYPEAQDQIENRSHPDVVYLEPEGKSRIIKVESVREKLVETMNVTSFSGGWKTGVICGADRMKAEAANSFLKTLEEPTAKTMFLLLTDAPEMMLPTIISRTQRIDLEVTGEFFDEERAEEIMEMTKAKDTYGLAAMLKELKAECEDGDEAMVRKAFFRTIMKVARGLMVSGKLEDYRAFRNVEAVEDAYRQSEKSMSEEDVISQLMDRLALG